MSSAKDMNVAEALNYAIWVRDNVQQMKSHEITKAIIELGNYRVFSSRQISAVIGNKASHTTISSITGKKDKTGGKLNVASLEVLRNILYSRSGGETNYGLITKALQEGTSQGMISKLTGVSQSSISRRLNG
jgi:hypothetical protein